MDGHGWSKPEDEDEAPAEDGSVRAAQEAIAEAFGATFEGAVERAPGALPEDVAAELDAFAEPFDDDAPSALDEVEAAARQALGRAETLRMVEALLFAAAEPLDVASLRARLPDAADVAPALEALQVRYEAGGVNLVEVDGRWMFRTAPDLAVLLEHHREKPRKLSKAATETLSIIAYHQPCTRAEIEDVRGVAVSKGSLDVLLEIGWIAQKGRREAPGRPSLYVTTPAFLEHFGLASVSELPGLADLKAAGLLDGRLPPGFAVPTPNDASAFDEEDAPEAEFVEDFEGGDEPVAEAAIDDADDEID